MSTETDEDRDYRAYYDSTYLRAWDLPPGKNVTLTIDHTERVVIKSPDKKEDARPVVFFRARNGSVLKKGLVLNKGMGKIVAALYGKHTRAWRGKEITVYATTCTAFDETFDVVRIRPSVMKDKARRGPPEPPPPPALPEPENIRDADFEEAPSHQGAE